MHRHTFWTLGLVSVLAVACDTGGGKDDSGDDSGLDDTDDPGGGDGGLDIAVSWTADGIEFVFEPAVPGDWTLGIAETATDDDPWTGEDCAYGYVLDDGSVLGPYCHGLQAGSESLSLAYGGDPNGLQAGTTVFGGPEYDGQVTYVLFEEGDAACYVWGDDVSYYDSLGCAEL